MTDHWSLRRYRADATYLANYEAAPSDPPAVDVPVVPGEWTFCGLPVASPLGIPAGPLLNGRWVLHYAALGFDVLTYKTVRSVARECYPLPNLVPVDVNRMHGDEDWVPQSRAGTGSWAVSFGMPSMAPDVWRADIEWTKRRLPRGKLLSVSVVASVQPDWTLDDLAADYAQCAKWAVDAGADCVETNFSCPNVSTCDGQLYQQPEAAGMVAERVRAAIGTTPYVVKIGHTSDAAEGAALLAAFAGHANALAMTNSVATRVRGPDGRFLFDGQRRGICGDATREASIAQVRLFAQLASERGLPTKMIAVGGVSTADHVRACLAAGAESVHIATAAMLDPEVALKIRCSLGHQANLG
jgi:dihydroorotate dehydrogenase